MLSSPTFYNSFLKHLFLKVKKLVLLLTDTFFTSLFHNLSIMYFVWTFDHVRRFKWENENLVRCVRSEHAVRKVHYRCSLLLFLQSAEMADSFVPFFERFDQKKGCLARSLRNLYSQLPSERKKFLGSGKNEKLKWNVSKLEAKLFSNLESWFLTLYRKGREKNQYSSRKKHNVRAG